MYIQQFLSHGYQLTLLVYKCYKFIASSFLDKPCPQNKEMMMRKVEANWSKDILLRDVNSTEYLPSWPSLMETFRNNTKYSLLPKWPSTVIRIWKCHVRMGNISYIHQFRLLLFVCFVVDFSYFSIFRAKPKPFFTRLNISHGGKGDPWVILTLSPTLASALRSRRTLQTSVLPLSEAKCRGVFLSFNK